MLCKLSLVSLLIPLSLSDLFLNKSINTTHVDQNCRSLILPLGGAKDRLSPGGRMFIVTPIFNVKVTAPALHQHCTSTAPALHQHCTSTAPALHHHCTITAPSLRSLLRRHTPRSSEAGGGRGEGRFCIRRCWAMRRLLSCMGRPSFMRGMG